MKPHAFRHTFASAVLDAADGNTLIARDAGGWASATTGNRTLDERLKAARSNLRFQDRRVADLEARIAAPGSTT